MMTKKTAEKVADLLGLTEEYLAAGRPRKKPGKPRPQATDIYGRAITTLTRKIDFWGVEKCSLVGAFKLAAYDQMYSKNVMEWAEAAVIDALGEFKRLADIDNEWEDTREVQRLLRRARRRLEGSHLS